MSGYEVGAGGAAGAAEEKADGKGEAAQGTDDRWLRRWRLAFRMQIVMPSRREGRAERQGSSPAICGCSHQTKSHHLFLLLRV